MALRPGPLVPHQPMLVADDRVLASPVGNSVRVEGPEALRGLIEVRGIGIVSVPFVPEAELALVVDLVGPEHIERLPEPLEPADICDRKFSRLLMTPFEGAAPLKLLLALARCDPAAH